MKGSQVAFVVLMLITLAQSSAQAANFEVELLWAGIFGPYSKYPLPNDPLPEVSLFPYGEIPRPLVQTNRIPAKLGTRFGLLFSLHESKQFTVTIHHIVYFPSPGLKVGTEQIQKSERNSLCFIDRPCYVGYFLGTVDEIMPGEWRMEVLVDGVKVLESTFNVGEKETTASNKFIKFIRSAHPTGKPLRASPAAYESRWAP